MYSSANYAIRIAEPGKKSASMTVPPPSRPHSFPFPGQQGSSSWEAPPKIKLSPQWHQARCKNELSDAPLNSATTSKSCHSQGRLQGKPRAGDVPRALGCPCRAGQFTRAEPFGSEASKRLPGVSSLPLPGVVALFTAAGWVGSSLYFLSQVLLGLFPHPAASRTYQPAAMEFSPNYFSSLLTPEEDSSSSRGRFSVFERLQQSQVNLKPTHIAAHPLCLHCHPPSFSLQAGHH